MVRRAGCIDGNVPVSQDSQSAAGKICQRAAQYASEPDSQGVAGNYAICEKEVD